MAILSEHSVFIFVAQLGVIIIFARIFGELARKIGQPVVVGEVIAGVILGPTIFGNFLPELYQSLFPTYGHQPYLLQGISWLCVIFLLLITGLELDLRSALHQGKHGIVISFSEVGLAFAGVVLIARFLPNGLYFPDIPLNHAYLLLGTALAVDSIPIIAKILLDLRILQSEVGLKILTAGVLSDMWAWSILAVVLAYINTDTLNVITFLKPLVIMVVYLFMTLRIGSTLVDKALDFLGYKEINTTVALSILFSLALLNGAIAHMLGIHVIFGAFIAGVMAGESQKITPYVRQSTQEFILGVFAPIFFVLIGMQLQLHQFTQWIPLICLIVFSLILKIGGAYIGALICGLGKRNSLAVACGLSTQGTMGIIIALIGKEMHIFNDALFSIIVIICVMTSISVGPLLKWGIQRVRRPLADFFGQEHVFLDIEGGDKKEVIHNMSLLMEKRKIVESAKKVEQAIWDRELTLSTAIGEGVALPHARLRNLKEPILCFFRLKNTIDYGSPDNKPVNLLFLELTDKNDEGMQLNLIAQVARFISSEKNRERLLLCKKEEQIHHILSFDENA